MVLAFRDRVLAPTYTYGRSYLLLCFEKTSYSRPLSAGIGSFWLFFVRQWLITLDRRYKTPFRL